MTSAMLVQCSSTAEVMGMNLVQVPVYCQWTGFTEIMGSNPILV